MAALLAGILSENTLRKRRILRDDWFVNPTRYLIIRSSYEFFPSFLPPEHNFYHRFRSFNRSGGGSRLFILKEFFTGTIRSCLLFFEKKKEKRNHRPRSLYVALSFLYDLRDHYASSNRNLIAPRFEKSASGIEESFPFRARVVWWIAIVPAIELTRATLSWAWDRQMWIAIGRSQWNSERCSFFGEGTTFWNFIGFITVSLTYKFKAHLLRLLFIGHCLFLMSVRDAIQETVFPSVKV